MSDLSWHAREEGTEFRGAALDPNSVEWNTDKCVSSSGHLLSYISPLDRAVPDGLQMVDCKRRGCKAVGIARYQDEGAAIVTLDDLVITVAVLNLKDGKAWMNYAGLKQFFQSLSEEPDRWPITIAQVVQTANFGANLDHSMTRLMGISGLVSYLCNTGDDYWYMEQGQVGNVMETYRQMGLKDQKAVVEIARLYGVHLAEIGR